MSRIGKQPVKIPTGVTVDITATDISIKGSKGTLSFNILEGVQITQEADLIHVNVANPTAKQERAFW